MRELSLLASSATPGPARDRSFRLRLLMFSTQAAKRAPITESRLDVLRLRSVFTEEAESSSEDAEVVSSYAKAMGLEWKGGFDLLNNVLEKLGIGP